MGQPLQPEPRMLTEIREQPAALRNLLDSQPDRVKALAAEASRRSIDLLFLAARGTSDHAAVYLKYLSEITAGIPAALAAPSVFTLYKASVRLDRALVLGISQSGRAADAIEVLARSRAAGYLTACITNEEESPMAAAAEHPLFCSAGRELSLPATKTYTTSLALCAAIAAALGDDAGLLEDLKQTPALVEQVLAQEDAFGRSGERYRYMEKCVVLARGLNLCSALETALKLSETSYLRAQPFSAADFLHGPIAVVDEGYPCILMAPSGPGHETMLEVASELRKRGAELIVVSDSDDILEFATTALPIPRAPDRVAPIVEIVATQLFAYFIATIKGRDPDNPRGLKKVTHTF